MRYIYLHVVYVMDVGSMWMLGEYWPYVDVMEEFVSLNIVVEPRTGLWLVR